MSEGAKKQRSIGYYLGIILAFVLLVITALFLLRNWEKQQGGFPNDGEAVWDDIIQYQGKQYRRNENVQTFLVMGLDKFGDDIDDKDNYIDQRADFSMLFVLDHREKSGRAIVLNRDTMVNINRWDISGTKVISTFSQQLSLAYTYGNSEKMCARVFGDSVSDLFGGAPMNYYAAVTMDAVPILNELVGGVEVEVLDDFTDIDEALVQGEKVTLTGEQALRYVRTRQGLEDGTNENRIARQKQYLEALYQKTLSIMESNPEFVVQASEKMNEHLSSNASLTRIQDFMKLLQTYDMKGINLLQGKSEMGEQFIEFYPDKDALDALIVDMFYLPIEG